MSATLILTALALGAHSLPNAVQVLMALRVKNSAAPVPREIPGLARFLSITGHNKAARQLYDEMMAKHSAIIKAFENDPKDGNRRMGEFLAVAADRTRAAKGLEASSAATLADHGEAALFLFVRSDPRFVDDPELRNVLVDIIAANKLREALSGAKAVPAIKELFFHWLSREPNIDAVCFAFSIAESDNVDGALPAALTVIKGKDTPNYCRAKIMIEYVAKFGGKENLKDLAPFLTDTEDFGFSQLNSEPRLFCQFRDVVLAVSVQLSGQKVEDYGLKPPHRYGFPSDAARSAAFEKWKAWTEQNDKK